MRNNNIVTLGCMFLEIAVVFGGVHDCWDPEKLRRMKFNANQGKTIA